MFERYMHNYFQRPKLTLHLLFMVDYTQEVLNSYLGRGWTNSIKVEVEFGDFIPENT